jgi:tetratricopeptide (TPR) repeat protein
MEPPASDIASTTSPALSSEVHPIGGKSFRRRLALFLSAPALFVYRHPARALLRIAISALVAGLLVAAGLWIWFDRHLHLARVELEKGHNTVAIRHLQLCQWLRPENREVLLLASRIARRMGSLDDSELLLNSYWQRYGDEEQLVSERVFHRAVRGDIESVGQSLRMYIIQGGGQARLAREALVTGLIYRFRWGDAQVVLDEWLAETPNDTLALVQKGKFLEQQQGFDEALRIYRRILELDPDQHEARLRLATILVTRRYGEEAASELTVLREKLPNNPEVLLLWARSLALLGRTAESRRAVDECLQLSPNYPSALLERGNYALQDGDEIEAERYFAKAVKLDAGSVPIHNRYAFVLGRLGKQTESAAEYAKVHQLEADSERIAQIIRGPLQDNPNNPAIHHEIGVIALRGGLIKEALRWFTSALQVDPNHLPTHQVLATIYHELDNPALAAKHRAIAQKLSQQQRKN